MFQKMQNRHFAKKPISNVLWKCDNKIAKKQFTLPVNKINRSFKLSKLAEFSYKFNNAKKLRSLSFLLLSNQFKTANSKLLFNVLGN